MKLPVVLCRGAVNYQDRECASLGRCWTFKGVVGRDEACEVLGGGGN